MMRSATLVLALTLPALVINLPAQKRDFLTPFETRLDKARAVPKP